MLQDSVPAGSYNDPFLSSVISMVAPTRCHGPIWGNLLCGVNADWTDFRIYTFELVIRLSKLQQMALLLSTVFEESRCPGGPRVSRRIACLPSAFVLNSQKLRFPAASALNLAHDMSKWRQQACPFPAGVVSLVSGEVKHVVHLIRWNPYSRYMPLGLTGTRACCGTIARPLGFRNWFLF